MIVGGLLGTGKTTGILQATEGLDVAYVLAQKDEGETGSDYINFLKDTDKKYIVFDEYTRILDRDALDRYLLTAVQNGKRIILTATEFIELEFLNYGVLNHRVQTLHTTKYDLSGEYALKDFNVIQDYLEKAIVKNLATFMKDEISEEIARVLTYTVLYQAVCLPQQHSKVAKEHFLEMWDVDATINPNSRYLKRVFDIFEQADIIARKQDFENMEEQYSLINQSLEHQLLSLSQITGKANKT